DLARREAEADRALFHVGFPLGEQLVRHFLVPFDARALEYGLLVPIEAEPGEAVEDHPCVLLRRASLVGVLDAEQELPAHMARVEPIEESGPSAADVEIAGGGGGEADAGGSGDCQVSGVRVSGY